MENIKLRKLNDELLTAFDCESKMKIQYKKMLYFSDSRWRESRNELMESENKYFGEKLLRQEKEENIRIMKMALDESHREIDNYSKLLEK